MALKRIKRWGPASDRWSMSTGGQHACGNNIATCGGGEIIRVEET